MNRRNEKGQAAVELALLFPLLFLFILLLVQVGLLVQRQVLVVHAAREGAREAAVETEDSGIPALVAKRSSLESSRLLAKVKRNAGDDTVEVMVRYEDPTDVPLVGPLLPTINLSASVVMHQEGR